MRILVAHREPLLSLGLVSALCARGIEAHIADVLEAPDVFWDGSHAVALLDYATVFKLMWPIERRSGLRSPKMVVLAASHRVPWVRAAAELGTTGYLSNNCEEGELIDAVYAVNRGQRYVCGLAAEQLANGAYGSQLTVRQCEVLGMFARGHSTKAIASQLKLSLATVTSHVKEVLNLLQVTNLSKAVSYDIRQGLAPQAAGENGGWAEEMDREAASHSWTIAGELAVQGAVGRSEVLPVVKGPSRVQSDASRATGS